MQKVQELLSEGFGALFGLVLVVGYLGSLPMAFIYGGKLDLLIAFFLPFYGWFPFFRG